jgi:hypothetical protein
MSMREIIDGLNLIFIDFHVPALTPLTFATWCIYMRVYPKVSGLAAWSEKCK